MATASKKQAEVVAEKPEPRKAMEVARSGPMDLRAMRQLSSSLYATVHQFMHHNCVKDVALETAKDTAAEYNWILKEIDAFYVKARHGIGNVKIYLIAESEGFTRQMEISIREKEPEEGWTVATYTPKK